MSASPRKLGFTLLAQTQEFQSLEINVDFLTAVIY